jgi:Na+-transporting methylmalonyl-CoA/oxaloacetate decarboxylase gamma subunit
MKDYSNKDLQGFFFGNEDLSNAVFSGSDLRGADFTNAKLAGADFTKVRTGIMKKHVILLFVVAMTVSLFSGYMAMLTGTTIQEMLASKDILIHASGMLTIALVLLLIACFFLKGIGRTIKNIIVPTCLIAIAVGLIGYLTGVGTGMGMVYLVLTVFLVTVMFIVGTIARTTAGSLSVSILFIAVAIGGGMFGKSLGGGIGTLVMALACALISKRALSGAKGFESLRKIAFLVTRRFGTSFRNSNLSYADFTAAKIKNIDFTGAETSSVTWGNTKFANCISGLHNFTIKT